MIDRGFMRIAIGLFALVAISAIGVGVYLYFNFNSQSRLPLIVPNNATWFVQIQTKKLKEDYKGNKPAYYDSFYQLIANAPVFKNCEDAGTPGIGLFSDVVLFETPNAKFMGLSVTSENNVSAFLDVVKSQNIVHGNIQMYQYTYVIIVNLNLYFAYKFKAMVFMEPFDSTENISFNEKALSEVFSGKESKFIQSKVIQTLYNHKETSHVIWYHKHVDSKFSTPIELAMGFNLGNEKIGTLDASNIKALKLSKLQLAEVVKYPCLSYFGDNIFYAKSLCLGTNYYENKANCDQYLGFDSASFEIKDEKVLNSSNYLNTLFKGAFEYLKKLK